MSENNKCVLYMLDSKEQVRFFSHALPVILIIFYILYPKHFVAFAHQTLGKIIAIVMICLFSYQDVIHGVLVCLLVILFYHQNFEGFVSKMTTEYAEYLPKASKKENISQYEENLEKDFTHVDKAYPDNLKPIKKVSEHLFRKEKCIDSKVCYKNQSLRNNLVTHVYPELQFRKNECNPCDSNCHYTIDYRQKTEKELKPINTHTTLMDDVKELFGFKSADTFISGNMTASAY